MEKEIYRHYGNNKFDKDNFIKVTNALYSNKPKGGLWASPTKDVDLSWKEWCEQEEFKLGSLDKHFDFTLKDNAKVLTITSIKDLDPLPLREDEDATSNVWVNLDFETIAKEYDAMMVYLYRDTSSEEEYYKTLIRDNSLYYKLYGWDVDSIVVFNPDIVEVIYE